MRIGVFQAACGGLDFDDRLDRLSSALEGQDLDLAVTPELFATGYHIGGRHRALAEPAQGRVFDALAGIARDRRTAIAYGYAEAAGDKVYNAAALVGPDGALLANHRKRRQSPNSFEVSTFDNGDRSTMVELHGVRVAICICYEIELAETARAAALAGADLLLVPTALIDIWDNVAEKLIPTRAFENGLWLAYANHGGEEGGYTYFGGSRIVAPDGREVAVAGQGEELLFAVVDAASVAAARERMPYLRDCNYLRV